MQRIPDTKGGNFDKCPAKQKTTTTNKQNATLLHLQYLLAKIDLIQKWRTRGTT